MQIISNTIVITVAQPAPVLQSLTLVDTSSSSKMTVVGSSIVISALGTWNQNTTVSGVPITLTNTTTGATASAITDNYGIATFNVSFPNAGNVSFIASYANITSNSLTITVSPSVVVATQLGMNTAPAPYFTELWLMVTESFNSGPFPAPNWQLTFSLNPDLSASYRSINVPITFRDNNGDQFSNLAGWMLPLPATTSDVIPPNYNWGQRIYMAVRDTINNAQGPILSFILQQSNGIPIYEM